MEDKNKLMLCALSSMYSVVTSMNNVYLQSHILNLMAAVLLIAKIKKRKPASRKYWVRPLLRLRKQQGEYHNLIQEMRLQDTENFFIYFRMTKARFDDLLGIVFLELERFHTSFREPISPGEQLAMTLRYLAHGDSQRIISMNYRVGKSTICKIIRRTCKILWKQLAPKYLKFPTMSDWKKIACDFENMWNFPNCLGAIDGKHVAMQAPANSGSNYFNYKGTFSIVLLAVCDANYMFTMVDVGSSGRQSDGGIFSHSKFGRQITDQTIDLPCPEELKGSPEKLPYVFVADEAFPLLTNLMRPFSGRNLPLENKIFNYRLSRARRIIENTFGILASKWRIYRRPIIASVETVECVIMATISLHNYLRSCDMFETNQERRYCSPGFVDYETSRGEIHGGLWRDNNSTEPLGSMPAFRRHDYSHDAKTIRNAFTNYFSSADGEVPWQYNVVMRGAQGE